MSEIIRAVIGYVRALPSVDDPDAIGAIVFKFVWLQVIISMLILKLWIYPTNINVIYHVYIKVVLILLTISGLRNCLGNVDDKVNRFKQSIQYYVNGTKEGFLKYRPKIQGNLKSYGSLRGLGRVV